MKPIWILEYIYNSKVERKTILCEFPVFYFLSVYDLG